MTHPRPLDGLRVLDLSRAVAGPFAGRILADLGADVVKAELPGTDVAQSYGKVIRGRSGLYSHVNAGKRSILLDLHQPAGVERLLDLAAACDVLVENFRPGVLDRFGTGWPVLAAANPRLVMLSISGFGQDGEDAGRAAYAPVIHAEAGLIGRQADLTGDPPEDIAFALADTLAGLHGTIAILAALRLRDRTGTGQHIDLSMLEAMLATDDYTHYSIDEHPVWPARGEVWPAPGGPILVSADRRYLWRVLKDCFGLADPDPGASLEEKVRARAQVISAWMAGHPDRDALKRDLDQARLAWADIRHGGDVLAAPSVAGRGTIVEVTDGDGERRSVVRMPYRFSGASSGPPRGVPEPGEHTDAVLRDWTSDPELPYRWSAPTLSEEGRMAPPGQTARKPTLETVAVRAGVSKSLVSLVLRNSPKVSATSREAVMQAVAELGYRPNAAARLLAERRSHTIGVLLNDLRQPWFADMLDGLTPALHAGGKHILLGDGRIDRMLDETLTWSFIDFGVDGLVLAGSIPMSQAIIDAASQIPTVAVGGRGLDVGLPRADVLANDNHLGAALAVRHLAGLGHARIAHIHGLPSVAGRVRMQGYEDTMRAAGLGGHVQIEAGDMSEEGGYRATVRLMSQPARPTAIFAANDLTCVGALSAAAALGIGVPEELSLVGFDNSVFARLRALWLTSVDATAFEMGQQAARKLLARIDHPDAPGETILLPPRLEVRGSTGPAPA